MGVRDAWIEKRLAATVAANGSRNVSQMHYARQGVITEEMAFVAQREKIHPELVRSEVARGRAIIPANIHHRNPRADGHRRGVQAARSTRTSATPLRPRTSSEELKKLHRAVHYGADTVMDLSTGGDIPRSARRSSTPRPCRSALCRFTKRSRVCAADEDLSIDLMLEVIEEQAEQGVDYMTIHAGVLREFRAAGAQPHHGHRQPRRRAAGAVDELPQEAEFPLRKLRRICKIFKKHDVSFSLGDGLRPGCLADASDEAQFAELQVLGELTKKAWEHDVQVMIEGPGHIPMDQIELQVKKEMELCHEAPFYTLGPLVTDIAPGYDHITSAIGAAMIGWHGASMLCYVTPKEHLGLAQCGRREAGRDRLQDCGACGGRGAAPPRRARPRRRALSYARFLFDWNKQFELSLDPETARAMHDETLPDDFYKEAKFCSMCGPKFCSMNITQLAEALDGKDQSERQQKFVELLAKVDN